MKNIKPMKCPWKYHSNFLRCCWSIFMDFSWWWKCHEMKIMVPFSWYVWVSWPMKNPWFSPECNKINSNGPWKSAQLNHRFFMAYYTSMIKARAVISCGVGSFLKQVHGFFMVMKIPWNKNHTFRSAFSWHVWLSWTTKNPWFSPECIQIIMTHENPLI